jgi:hypothetical protein
MKTYHADSNDHDAVARALLEKYQDQQAVSKALHALESIAHRYASALMAAASETYSTDVEKASRQAKTDLTNALQAFLAAQAAPATDAPDAARWRAWAGAMVEANENDDGAPLFDELETTMKAAFAGGVVSVETINIGMDAAIAALAAKEAA